MNKQITIFLLIWLSIAGCGQSDGNSAAKTAALAYNAELCSEYTYTTDGSGTLLIGDSNTFTLPADILAGNYVNCGTIGFDSQLAYNKLIEKFPIYNPGIVVVWIGTNDARNDKSDAYFSQNMTQIFDFLKSKNVQVYIRNILPSGADLDLSARTAELNLVTEMLISSYTYTYLNSRRFFEDASGYLLLQYTYDGLHLNASGQDILRQHFFEP